MAYKNQPSKVSATQWGKTVTIEVDHSDTDLLELIEMFKGLAVGLEYSESSWRSVIKDLASMYEEEDTDDLKHKLNELRLDAGIARIENQQWLCVLDKETGMMIDPMIGLEKFAELIVRECAEVGDSGDSLQDGGIARMIKQHFGVEE